MSLSHKRNGKLGNVYQIITLTLKAYEKLEILYKMYIWRPGKSQHNTLHCVNNQNKLLYKWVPCVRKTSGNICKNKKINEMKRCAAIISSNSAKQSCTTNSMDQWSNNVLSIYATHFYTLRFLKFCKNYK